jgi:PKD repeat protein
LFLGKFSIQLHNQITNQKQMKKHLLLKTTAFALLSVGVMAQSHSRVKAVKPTVIPVAKNISQTGANTTNPPAYVGTKYDRCNSKIPTKQWDEWFNGTVEEYKEKMATQKNMGTAATTYTIPVIFHVVSYTASTTGTVPVGTYPNLTQAQVNSQITVLNQDYGGTSSEVATYTALKNSAGGPFYDYAHGNSLPAPDNTTAGGVMVANTGITFCLAGKNPSGVALTEPGIDRINAYKLASSTTYTNTNPAQTTLTANNFSDFIDAIIKPPTIWDPTKYFNVWLTDCAQAVGLLGYSTFPTGTNLTGLSGGGSGTASTTTDGCWVLASACGNTGHVSAPYNLGRTLTHESGHYFGLRHTWGDGACLTDYCNDTPPEGAATYYGSGTSSSSWVYPYTATDNCTATGAYNSDLGDGIMYMDFMDYSDDKYMCMFTNDQLTRMAAALAQCSDRKGLTTSAVGLCNLALVKPVAGFTPPTKICVGVAEQFTDASTGPPTSWTWSVTPNTGVTVTTSTLQSPSITFPSAGTYSVTLVATNTVGTNSTTQTVTAVSCNITSCDTLSNFLSNDSLTVYPIGKDSGYVSGTNIYGDLAKAEYYNSAALTNTQINSVICLFFKDGTQGTHGTGTVTLNILGGDNTNGPTGAALGTATASLASIVATTAVTNVDYCGDAGLAFSTAIIVPYTFKFATPITTPASGFFASLNILSGTGDTLVVFNNTQGTQATTNTSWELDAPSPGTWAAVEGDWGFTNPVSFAILPVVCPKTVTGIEHNELGSGINLFPNPNNGQFSFAVTLPEATNLNFTVVNMLGQVVYAKAENNISNAVLSCDLSHLAKGVYYANITDSNNNKTVKKIIIE